jgi:hypothetical protein
MELLPDMQVTMKTQKGAIVAYFSYKPRSFTDRIRFAFGKIPAPRIDFAFDGRPYFPVETHTIRRFGIPFFYIFKSSIISVDSGSHTVELYGENVSRSFSHTLSAYEL